MHTPLHEITTDLYAIGFPLKMLGADVRRNVTVIRLKSGKLVIHSSAPFAPGDIVDIRALGTPAWLIDTLLRHDTFAREGRDAFPEVSYLAPEGFGEELDFPIGLLSDTPAEWAGELDILEIAGAPSFRETGVLHRASRTLIVADLLFNFGNDEPLWTELLLKAATVHGEHSPGISRPFKAAVEDEPAFLTSIRTLLEWDFDRIIVGHGDLIPANGKALLQDAIAGAGFEL